LSGSCRRLDPPESGRLGAPKRPRSAAPGREALKGIPLQVEEAFGRGAFPGPLIRVSCEGSDLNAGGDPKLSAQQRAWFGLEADESIRVLSCDARTILLERTGGAESFAMPWDREVVLVADVRAFALGDLLRLLHESAKSGYLHFEGGDHAKAIWLDRGQVIFAASNQMVDRLGQCLLRAGIITPEQFREARDAYSPKQRFGAYLVQKGYLTPRQLWDGVKIQVQEIVRSLFSYGTGKVVFWEGDVQPDNAVRLALPTESLVAEGLFRPCATPSSPEPSAPSSPSWTASRASSRSAARPASIPSRWRGPCSCCARWGR
jgi:hypothetical protein